MADTDRLDAAIENTIPSDREGAKKAMLVDVSKCIGCRGCHVACKQWNELPGEKTTQTGSFMNPVDRSPTTWTVVHFNEYREDDGTVRWLLRQEKCQHCTEAACVMACPTAALYHDSLGFVGVDRDKCIGCRYCVIFCPFDIPRVVDQKVGKCTMCQDRVPAGRTPACAKTCPPGSLTWGDREDIVTKGLVRVEELKQRGFPKAMLYGDKLLGGLGVMYVLTHDDPTLFGLPKDPQIPALTSFWKDIMEPVGTVLFGGTVAALVINYIVARASLKEKPVEEGEGEQ